MGTLIIVGVAAFIVVVGLILMNRPIKTQYTTAGEDWDEIESAWQARKWENE